MVVASLVIMDLNWSGDGLGVAASMFCTEVGERGNPQELVVARAILATSLVTLPTQMGIILAEAKMSWEVVSGLFRE